MSHVFEVVCQAISFGVLINNIFHVLDGNESESPDDVADVFFVDYSAGTSLMAATAWDGMMYMDGADYALSWGGEKRLVSTAGRTANNMQDRFFLDGAGIDFNI